MTAIIREDASPVPTTVPAPLRWIIERLLSKDAKDRYDSTQDLYRDLKQLSARVSDIVPITPAASAPSTRRLRGWWWLAPGALAGFLAAALWPGPPAAAPRQVPFASDADVETMPAWSPKGDRIAYAADVNGTLQIFSKDVALRTTTQMTHQKDWCYGPAWSEDGAHIFFQSGGSLYSVAVAGGQPQRLLTGVSRAAISSDGRSLATIERGADGRAQLAFSTPIGAPLRVYAHPSLAAVALNELSSSIAFTQDGRALGLIADEAGRARFWKIPVTGGAPEVMTYAGTNFAPFVWIGNQRVAVASIGAGDTHLAVSDLGSGASYALTAGSAKDEYPALSPDGRTLAFSSGEAGYAIVEIPLDGSPAREVVASSRQAVAPSLAPDGVHLAYATNRSGVAEIWLRNRADGSERQIVGRREFEASGPLFLDSAVSPDGTRVAFRRSAASGAHEIWISPLAGGAPVRLWNDPGGAFQRGPTWSPDGDWIAYYSLLDGQSVILKIRVGANTPPELVAHTNGAAPPVWSPAGNRLAFRDGARLAVVAPDGKDLRVVSQRRWETYGWSKDGSQLFGIAADEQRHLILMRVEIASGQEHRVADLGSVPPGFDLANFQGSFWYRGFSLTPDGRSFLTSVYHLQAHIWLMEDFDRPNRLLDVLFGAGGAPAR
jgi:TolB protein